MGEVTVIGHSRGGSNRSRGVSISLRDSLSELQRRMVVRLARKFVGASTAREVVRFDILNVVEIISNDLGK